MTQVILMLSQLVLLPLQVRLWGQSATAHWYAALALATITYVVDCGLRTAGHAELIKADADSVLFQAEAVYFLEIWSWIRILIVVVTVCLFAGDVIFNQLSHGGTYPLWRVELILACALETVLLIRITYLDSLGRYRGAEASYFCFALLRLSLSLPALLIFRWDASKLANIYLLTSAIALFAQGHWLCRSTPLLQLAARFPVPSWKVLALARHTVAEPVANWIRLSLPVLVIGQIAPPMAVTTYVALRAVFGAGRTTVQQLARVASVEVLKTRVAGKAARAESLLTVFVVSAVFFGACVGFFVVIDNMRLLGLWLKHFDRTLFQQVALAFSLTAPFFSYQIPMNLMFRTGLLAALARRHYAFAAYSAAFAALALVAASLPLYLCLLVLAEITLSISFFISGKSNTAVNEKHAGSAAFQAAMLCSLVTLLFWILAHWTSTDLFLSVAAQPMLESAALLIATIAVMAVILYTRYGRHVHALRTLHEPDPALAMQK